MGYIWKMAIRDLMRNRRRSFFSSLAVGLGLAILIFLASFIAGEMRQSLQSTMRLESGHLQVRGANYDPDKSSLKWEDLVSAPGEVAGKIAALPQVELATPRLLASGILGVRSETVGIRVIGIDTTSPANAPYRDGLVAGQFLAADDREGILIGKPLADKLDLQVGQQLSMMINTSEGEVAQQTFVIRGIYSTETYGYDMSTVFMPLAKAQAITQTGDRASLIFILLKDRETYEAVAAAIPIAGYKVETWRDLNPILVLMEDFVNSFIYALYLIVLGITATVVINTLIMSVFERTREIGILSALGMKGRTVMLLFFLESAFLAVGGIVIGVALGLVFSGILSQTGFFVGNMGLTGILIGDRIYPYLRVDDVVILSVMAFFVTLLAAVYPAILAANMEPVEALHAQ